MTKIFVVIVNWNGFKDTKACLDSIYEANTKNIDLNIYVVDNASSDDSVNKLKKISDKFTLLVTKHNLGFAGGYNFGIRYAMQHKPDFILALNNDTIIDKDLFKDLVEAANGHPEAGLISPKIYFAEGYEFHKDMYKKNELGNVVWYAGGNIDWDNVYGSNRGVDEVDNGQFDHAMETDFATGAAMFMRYKALKKVGLFDEKYFLYLEDADLSMRMKRKKWQVLYAPDGKVWHKVSQSSGIGSNLNDYFITRNRLRFGMTYASLRTKIALLRESIKILMNGRQWQRVGVMDYYIGNFGKGSWK